MAEQGYCFGRSSITSAPHINMTPKAIKFQGLWLILPITVTEHVTENNFEEKERTLVPNLRKGSVHHGKKVMQSSFRQIVMPYSLKWRHEW